MRCSQVDTFARRETVLRYAVPVGCHGHMLPNRSRTAFLDQRRAGNRHCVVTVEKRWRAGGAASASAML